MAGILPAAARDMAANPTEMTDEQLAECWKSIAGHISYLNADDYGGDWKLVPLWRPALGLLDAEFDRRDIDRPSRAGFLL